MSTFLSSAGTKPRSLADDLRTRSDTALFELLTARPDLLHPIPTDIGQLAARATTAPSVNAALDSLNQIQLNVCEAIAGLGENASLETLHAGLRNVPGYDKAAVDDAVSHLLAIGLLWGDELRIVRSAAEAFGVHPCGLGPSYADSRRLVKIYANDPGALTSTLNDAPKQAREIMEQLLWNPIGTMKNANRPIQPENVKSPLEWLLSRELIIATSDSAIAVPREVGLALRQGNLLAKLESQPNKPVVNELDSTRIDQTGAHAALEFIHLVETLLESWSIEPPTQLRGGGLALRDLAAAQEILRSSTHITALVLEVCHVAGLLNPDANGCWLPTTTYDLWLNHDDATRWALVAKAWLDMNRAPHVVADNGTDRINALSAGVERSFVLTLRHTILEILGDAPTGSATTPQALNEYLNWHRPRRTSGVRTQAIAAILAESEAIGVTGAAGLTSFGRALIEHRDAAESLASLLPSPIDHIIVQADLTALAPGRLPATPRRTMSILADIESTGVATTYRFTETSIRRGLDQGQSAHEILEFLTTLSRTPLPQPLTYLIDDVARKHGVLRVGVASVYLRCDDPQLIASIQVDKRLTSLRLRQIAPGIVVSAAPADMVLEKLRSAGYAPVAESAEGTVLLHRPDARRTSSRPASASVTVTTASPRLINAAVKALRAGERVEETKSSGETPRTSTADTLTLLNEAMDSQREVWIGYADPRGITSERIIEPLTISSGFLTAFDLRSNEVKTFTIARITGAQYVQPEGSSS